jgi:hypothetical protein
MAAVEAAQGGLEVMPCPARVQAGQASSTHSAESPLSLRMEVEGLAIVWVQAPQTAQVLEVGSTASTMAMQGPQTLGVEVEVQAMVLVVPVDLGPQSCVIEDLCIFLSRDSMMQTRTQAPLPGLGLLTLWTCPHSRSQAHA